MQKMTQDCCVLFALLCLFVVCVCVCITAEGADKHLKMVSGSLEMEFQTTNELSEVEAGN